MTSIFEKKIVFVELEQVVITCTKCGLSFILTATIYNEEKEEIETMEQASFYYCPYCGEKND